MSRLVFSVADMVVVMVTFTFQLAGMVMVAGMFMGASVAGSVFLVAYEVVEREMRLKTYQM